MKRHVFIFLSVLACGVPASTLQAQQTDRIVWQQRPESVTLTVGRETALHFPAPVELKYPRALASYIEVVGLGRRVFIKPGASFEATRIHAQTIGGGSYYLFDLAASENQNAPSEIRIIDESNASSSPLFEESRDAYAGATDWSARLVPLVRFMASQFYGPERLARPLPGARRISIDDSPIDLVPLRHQVTAIPQAGWAYQGLYGYAVKLVNHGQNDYVVDPRDFRGNWVSATPQHALLTEARTPAAQARATNETIVYLTSTQPMRKTVALAARQAAP